MASPQKENGCILISNKILDELIKSNLTSRELKVILTIISYANNPQSLETELSIRFIAKKTGITFQNISRILKTLKNKNIINIFPNRNSNKGRIIRINRNFLNVLNNSKSKFSKFVIWKN